MSWFEEWFDSPLYEKLYSNRNDDEAALLADLIEEVIPKQRYPELLDLGCGRGRHSITLSLRGYKVTGIDLSQEAIKRAKERATERGADAEFLLGDMRSRLNRSFDAVVNLFTTFGYFSDDRENIKVIYNAESMLRMNGLLMIDYLNASQVRRNLVSGDMGSFKEIDFQINRTIEKDMVCKEITFSGPSLKKPVQYTEKVKLYDLEWFEKVYKNCGLELIAVLGDYAGDAFDTEKSARLIMLCRKFVE